MASKKDTPPEKRSIHLAEEENANTTRDKQSLGKFSTHPPPHRGIISGSFRLDPEEDAKKSTNQVMDMFSRLKNFDERFTNKTIGGVLLREFAVYEHLPYRLRDNIIGPVLRKIQQQTLQYTNEDGDTRFQLPTEVQIQQIILDEVLSNNRVHVIHGEIEGLMDPSHVDETSAEELIKRMENWFERYEVQLYAHSNQINLSAILADLKSTLVRAKTKLL